MKKNGELHYPVRGWCLKKCLFMMRNLVIILLVTTTHLYASTDMMAQKVSIQASKANLKSIIEQIEQQTHMGFLYNEAEIAAFNNMSLQVKDAEVGSVLEQLLKGTQLTYRIQNNTILLSTSKSSSLELNQVASKVIKGKVVDSGKRPLPGVSIYVKGSKYGVATDVNGMFQLEVPLVKDLALVFSFVGMKTQEVAIKEQKELLVTLQEETSDLDEVTIVGYGERKKRELISSISSVKATDIKEIPAANFMSLLQGRMAGVEITQQSGAPGGGGTVVAIRGYNSLFDGKGSDGTPLYVIDGVPMHSFTSPITGTNALAEIDPSTIESIEVLKDAASAAIYGSRAGNGVILITTKKGRKGDAKFSANVSYSGSILPEGPFQLGGRSERDFQLNSLRSVRTAYIDENGERKYPESYEEAYYNGVQYDHFWNSGSPGASVKWIQDSLNPFYNNSTNWFKKVFRTGKVINANIQAVGGGDVFQYMLGAGYYTESGIMQGSDFARVNLISNMTVRPTKNLKIDSRIYMAYSDKSSGPGANSLVNAQAIETLTVDPRSTSTLLAGGGEVEDELLKKLNSTVSKRDDYRLRANMVLDYAIINGLNVSVSGAVDYGQANSNVFEPSTLDPVLAMNKSTGRTNRDIMMQNENLIKYNFSIQDEHYFDILLGLSFTKNQSFGNTGYAMGTGNDLIYYVDYTDRPLYDYFGQLKSPTFYSSSFTENVMISYYGRLAYNYKRRYLMEATLRRDGSSVFGENNRYATFPSVALGWAFSEESFMKNVPWLSYGKIRGSWGTSGQVFKQDYLAHGLMKKDLFFNGKRGMTSNGVINKDLTWEESDQFDIGLDVDFWDYRLKFKFDYYYKYTKGLLYEVRIPGNFYGSILQDQNAMEISNEGLELEMEADILRQTKVTWRMRFNISRNWNRFEKSYLGTDINELVIGKPLAGLYLYDDLGIYNSKDQVPINYTPKGDRLPLGSISSEEIYAPGMRMIRDIDGNGTINEDDKFYMGSTYPLATGGWANEITWKNFDLNLLFNFSLGRKMVRLYGMKSLNANTIGAPLYEDIRGKHFWDGSGQEADYPMMGRYTYIPQFSGSIRSNMETVNWCKLKQLTLGYNLEKSIVNKLKLSGVRVFVTGENIFTMTNYSGIDPEVVSLKSGQDEFRNYPLSRKWTIGLTVNF